MEVWELFQDPTQILKWTGSKSKGPFELEELSSHTVEYVSFVKTMTCSDVIDLMVLYGTNLVTLSLQFGRVTPRIMGERNARSPHSGYLGSEHEGAW